MAKQVVSLENLVLVILAKGDGTKKCVLRDWNDEQILYLHFPMYHANLYGYRNLEHTVFIGFQNSLHPSPPDFCRVHGPGLPTYH